MEESSRIAPTPWIGKTATQTTEETQSWSPLLPGDATLSLEFTCSVWGLLRCFFYWMRANRRVILLCLLGFYVFLFVSPFITIPILNIVTGHQSSRVYPLAMRIQTAALSAAVNTIALPALHILVCFSVIVLVPNTFLKPTVLLFSNRNGSTKNYCLNPISGSLYQFRWQEIRRIENIKGDLFVIRQWPLLIFFVPRGAFPDAAQGQRFYEALVALWKSNGDMSEVPVSVREEFASKDDQG